MNSELEITQYRAKGLTLFQARLVADILAAPIPVRHLLVAGPGTGKSHTATFLAKQVAVRIPEHRILVVGPRALSAMYEYELTKALSSSRILVSSRRSLR